MLYFAIILVVIGILCLIYVSVHQTTRPVPDTGHTIGHREYPPLKESLFNAKYPDARKASYDDRIRTERQQFYYPPEPAQEEQETGREPLPPEIVESVEVAGNAPENVTELEIEFVLEGTLFLDRGRKIPFADKKLKEKNLVDELAGLSREGDGLMTEDRGVFHFRTGNAVYSYAVNDLEQIVFFDQGAVLIPIDRSLPAPLFLTDGVSQLKEYLVNKK